MGLGLVKREKDGFVMDGSKQNEEIYKDKLQRLKHFVDEKSVKSSNVNRYAVSNSNINKNKMANVNSLTKDPFFKIAGDNYDSNSTISTDKLTYI